MRTLVVLTAGLALLPASVSVAAAPSITSAGSLKDRANAIVTGPDGALWHTSESGRVGRTTTAGKTQEYAAGTDKPSALTVGPDDALWFATLDGPIGRVTTAGKVSTVGTLEDAKIRSIATGADGNLWFTSEKLGTAGAVGRMTPGGTAKVFSAGILSAPLDIARGPDDALWFTQPVSGGGGDDDDDDDDDDQDRAAVDGQIGRVSLTGQVTTFTTGLTPGRRPTSITAGPDGALWFTEAGGSGAIGRIAVGGSVKEFTTGLPPFSAPRDIVTGPDGALWFTITGAIGRITTKGAVTTYDTPGMQPGALTAGPGTELWFTDDSRNALGRVVPAMSAPGPTPTPTPPSNPTPTPTPTTGSANGATPVQGQTVVIGKESGTVRVKLRGRQKFRAVGAATAIPVGSTVDTRTGKVTLTSTAAAPGGYQTGTFYGGLFTVRQPAGTGTTQLVLRGRLQCRARHSRASAAGKRKRTRRVWGKDSGGAFSTKGRDSVTTVRGTKWLTEDRCGGTLTKVTAGSVSVRARATGKRFVLQAGDRHFVRHVR